MAPDIEVGIVKAARIRLSMKGGFVSGTGKGPWQGKVEAMVENNSLVIRQEGQETPMEAQAIFTPVEPGSSRFAIEDVVIGVGFHWEQKEEQEFQGALKLMVQGEEVQAVNVVSVEDYLVSVISSEMRGDSAPALLKAHTVISRSWLLAQIEKQDQLAESDEGYALIHESDEEYIRWYDREDHDLFHVCADDHCQRYQGTTRAHNPEVAKAVRETRGVVLEHGGRICDARFSKCCGGVVEEFQHCWEPVPHPYLKRVDDNPARTPVNSKDLKVERHAEEFIRGRPQAFCNTRDAALLRQVLNDYDQSFSDFYRWEITYTQEELASLIRGKSGIDFGEIVDMVPMERGESGRLVRLKIVGTKKTLIVGKELEIRRWLSPSHLYSSAFVVGKDGYKYGIPATFHLRGAGWGHGVGLCQIGAAVMANQGYTHQEILTHYFVDATLNQRYD